MRNEHARVAFESFELEGPPSREGDGEWPEGESESLNSAAGIGSRSSSPIAAIAIVVAVAVGSLLLAVGGGGGSGGVDVDGEWVQEPAPESGVRTRVESESSAYSEYVRHMDTAGSGGCDPSASLIALYAAAEPDD